MGGRKEPERIEIAKIVNTHGVDGEVKAIPLSDFEDRYKSLEQVLVSGPDGVRRLELETVRWHQGKLLMKFKGIDSMDAAFRLREGYVLVDRCDAVSLQEGQYYLFEIEGMQVFDVSGNKLGTVQEVLKTGANDVYVVKGHPEGKETLIPALKTVVLDIDVARNRMVVELPPGLAD